MSLPLFKATVLSQRSFEDSNSTKVIVRIDAMVLDGDLADLDRPEHRALDSKPTCFRLRGQNALDKIAGELTEHWTECGVLKANQHVSFKPGSSIYFQGLGPGEWDGKSTFKGEELLTMIRVLPDSITGAVTTRIRRVMTAATLGVETPQVETAEELVEA
jgi:hypothetical protein